MRVWETSAETRYMVIPLRPSGTEALGVDDLSALVTREALIGVALHRIASVKRLEQKVHRWQAVFRPKIHFRLTQQSDMP